MATGLSLVEASLLAAPPGWRQGRRFLNGLSPKQPVKAALFWGIEGLATGA